MFFIFGSVLVCTPLLFSSRFQLAFELPKWSFFHIATSLLAAALCIHLYLHPKNWIRFRNHILKQKIFLLLITGWLVFHLWLFFHSANRIFFIIGSYQKRFGFYTILTLILFGFMTSYLYLLYRKNFQKTFAILLPIPIFINVFLIIIEFIYKNDIIHSRNIGSFGQANYLSGFALLNSPFFFRFYQIFKNHTQRYYQLLTLLSCAFIIWSSGSRLAFALFLLLLIFHLKIIRHRKYQIIAIISFLGYASFFLLFRMANHQNQLHLIIWQAAIELVKENPLIGYGYDSYGFLLPAKMFLSGYRGIQGADRAHNEILDLSLATGFVGIVFVLAIYFYLVLAKKKRDPLVSTIILSTLLFWLRGMANTNSIYHYLFYFSLLGCLFANNTSLSDYQPKEEIHKKYYIFIFFIFLFGGKIIMDFGICMADAGYKIYRSTARMDYLRAAIRLNPWQIEYRLALLEHMNHLQKPFLLDSILPMPFQKQNVQPPTYYHHSIGYYRTRNNRQKICQLSQKQKRLQPWSHTTCK